MIWKIFAVVCSLSFSAHASDRLEDYPTIPGTKTPDRSQAPLIIEGDQVYRAIPGTRTPQRTGESWTIRDGLISPNIPGTNTPRSSREGWR